jgi:hypothetical protein
MKVVRIEALPGTKIAEDKDAAREIRERILLPALERQEPVVLDFRDVELATQSFIHALVSDPIHQHGDSAMKLIRFKNCTPELQQLVLTVVEYTLMAIESAGNGNGGDELKSSRPPP